MKTASKSWWLIPNSKTPRTSGRIRPPERSHREASPEDGFQYEFVRELHKDVECGADFTIRADYEDDDGSEVAVSFWPIQREDKTDTSYDHINRAGPTGKKLTPGKYENLREDADETHGELTLWENSGTQAEEGVTSPFKSWSRVKRVPTVSLPTFTSNGVMTNTAAQPPARFTTAGKPPRRPRRRPSYPLFPRLSRRRRTPRMEPRWC